MSPIKYSLAILLLLTLVSGCATTHDPSTWSAQEFYDRAREAMQRNDYQSAIQYYEDLEIRHPFSPYTQQAQLEVIHAYYEYNEPESAIAAAERYIKLYPRAGNVDYAYYLRGLVSAERGLSDFDLWLGLEADKRQPQSARNAYRYFEELITRFPESRYSADAKQRMVHLRNQLARHELSVADYYLRRGANLSAARRASYVVANFPQTPAIPDALVIMVQAYRELGIDDLAADALAVMKLNYPDHEGLEQFD